jgi:hypothetical protein
LNITIKDLHQSSVAGQAPPQTPEGLGEKEMKYYKILNQNEKHHGLKYHEGLNIDPVPFNPSGDCKPGGIYFAREDILAFLGMGEDKPYIREVILPEDAKVYENPDYPKKWKTNRVILGKKRKVDAQVVKDLIAEGANVHAGGDYVLRWAAYYGHIEVVKCLLEAGANIHARDDYALRRAAEYGHLEVVKCLLEAGANVHAWDDAALRLAAYHGHIEVVKCLLERGADVHARDDEALHRAARYGHIEAVKCLLERGADVHARNDSALCWAAENGHTEIVKILKEHMARGCHKTGD